MKYLFEHFRKTIYCNLELHDIKKKMMGVQEVIDFQKLLKNYNNFFCPLLINGIGSRIFNMNILVPSMKYILAIKIGRAVFERIEFMIFQKFFITVVIYFFLNWYLIMFILL